MSFRLLIAAALVSGVVGEELMIKSVDDFIDFATGVNKGTNYSGTTVFLDSDLSFAGKSFEPIGYSDSNYFRGVFDGQGHVIRNLEMNSSSSEYVGLFGYSMGFTIRNVILDSSCPITNSYIGSYSSGYAYTGGIIGACYANNGPCIIENNVNMGSVSFSGNISGSLYLGGIAGLFSLNGYDSTVKNCANYGDVTHSGESGYSYIGGLVGWSSSASSLIRLYIHNSLNHGTITHSGTPESLTLGGIVGYTWYTTIENCVSGGKISLLTTGSYDNYIGRIVGCIVLDTSINYCYFTSDLSEYSKYGYARIAPTESNTLSYDSTTFELNGTVSVGNYTGSSLIGALNAAADYYTHRDYSHWLLNKDNKDVSFTFNGEQTLTLNSQIILLPSLASEGNMSFDGWYKDSEHTSPLTEYEITNDIELYGRFSENTNNYTITFDTRRDEITVASITGLFGSVVTLPSDSIREHCTVAWWENKYGDKIEFNFVMPARNITLYAFWKCTHIETLDDFIGFSKIVNNRADSFNGTTVFLDSDIDLTGKTFEPIGYYIFDNDLKYFNGVFDGQGHVISNLNMTSSSRHVGLFGHSYGLTIRNVILDSSCSITSSFIGSESTAYTGGIIGYCYAEKRSCTIENSVNMGSVSFDGNTNDDSLNLGGIAGCLSSSSKYESTVKNCANYGDVTQFGESWNSYIGGITGYSRGHIYNCLNHGTITHSGTTSSSLYVGGNVGSIESMTIENCVSEGKISSSGSASTYNYIGSIAGKIYKSTIQYCYFSNDLNYGKYGSGTPDSESNTLGYDSTAFELNEYNSIGSYTGNSLIRALNAAADYYALREYSRWLLNKENKDVSFTINGRTSSIKMDYKIILIPSLVSEGIMSFDGWYTDKELTNPFTETAISEKIELYGKYCGQNYTVTFDVNGGDGLAVKEMTICCEMVYGDLPMPTRAGYTFDCWCSDPELSSEYTGTTMPARNVTLYAKWKINQYNLTIIFNNGAENEVRTLDFNEEIDYPEGIEKTGYTFNGWNNKPDKMPAENITVTAQWTANKYTVTFDVNGGNALSESESTKEVTYESTYGELPTPNRIGFTLDGWFTENNESITKESIVSISDNHTLHVHWLEVSSQVEIVFTKKDMTREEIEEVVKKYTNTEFEIVEVESGVDEVRVVIKFIDSEKAEEFFRNVKDAPGRGEKDIFKRIGFVQKGTGSLSITYHPIMPLLYLF